MSKNSKFKVECPSQNYEVPVDDFPGQLHCKSF